MHSPSTDYQLLDFGNGRKLERIGGAVIDRPCPAAIDTPCALPRWPEPDAIFDETRNLWVFAKQGFFAKKPGESQYGASDWICMHDGLRLSLKPTPAGQLGIFPEHWEHWPWLVEQIAAPKYSPSAITSSDAGMGLADTSQVRVLHLFAYTGGTTLALARAGCHVTHVDASKPTVAWARQNALLSNVGDRPIRWIVDDARDFVRKEIRRNKRYDAILLDPPSFGHGPDGSRWEIHRDLLPLLLGLCELVSDRPRCMLLTGHSTRIALREYNEEIRRCLSKRESPIECQFEITKAKLVDARGRDLDCGFVAKSLLERVS